MFCAGSIVRNIDTSGAKQAIVRGIATICQDLNVQVLAEGIETKPERDFLRSEGVELIQGYLFSKPALEAIGVIDPSWD